MNRITVFDFSNIAHMGIGVAADSTDVLRVKGRVRLGSNEDSTPTWHPAVSDVIVMKIDTSTSIAGSNTPKAFHVEMQANAASASNVTVRAGYFEATTQGTASYSTGSAGGIIGLDGQANTYGTGNVFYVAGINAVATNNTVTGTIDQMDGLFAFTGNFGPGTITSAQSVHTQRVISSGAVGSWYGVYVPDILSYGGTVTNSYGLYIESQTVGTNKWAIYSAGGLNYFGGHLTVEGVTSTGATGTGKFVFDNSPTFVTPTLGVAGATSITTTVNTNTFKLAGEYADFVVNSVSVSQYGYHSYSGGNASWLGVGQGFGGTSSYVGGLQLAQGVVSWTGSAVATVGGGYFTSDTVISRSAAGTIAIGSSLDNPADGKLQVAAVRTGYIYPASDSTTAVQVRKANGTTAILNFDTTNGITQTDGSNNPGFDMLITGTRFAFIRLATGTDSVIPGSVLGDLTIRTASQKILFSIDNGSTSALTIDTSGNLIAKVGRVGLGSGGTADANHLLSLNDPTNPHMDFKISSTEKAVIGVAVSGNQLVNGTSAGDIAVRSDGFNIILSADSGNTAHFKLASSGDITLSGIVQAAGYKSSDATAGVTAGPFTTITSIRVKNGLVTTLTGS